MQILSYTHKYMYMRKQKKNYKKQIRESIFWIKNAYRIIKLIFIHKDHIIEIIKNIWVFIENIWEFIKDFIDIS